MTNTEKRIAAINNIKVSVDPCCLNCNQLRLCRVEPLRANRCLPTYSLWNGDAPPPTFGVRTKVGADIKVLTTDNSLLNRGEVRVVMEVHEKYIVVNHGLYPTVSPVLFHGEYGIVRM